jgi:hypothetical protein
MNYYNYFTEIEEHFVKRRGKHLYVSPMDWSLIATWRDSGVPLHVALRGIDRAMDGFFARPHRSSAKVSSLFYCHDSVMSEYAAYLEYRVGAGVSDEDRSIENTDPVDKESGGPDKESVLEFLNARIAEINRLREKQSLMDNVTQGLDRILSRLNGIVSNLESDKLLEIESLERDLGILDDTLVTELREAIPQERMSEWQREAKKELKVYRKRLPKETYAKILENFLRGKIHRWFDLGELSLFHL